MMDITGHMYHCTATAKDLDLLAAGTIQMLAVEGSSCVEYKRGARGPRRRKSRISHQHYENGHQSVMKRATSKEFEADRAMI